MTEIIGPPRQHIIQTEIGDEISLYDPTSERVVVLNTSASDVWRLAEGDHDFEQVVQLLGRSYGVDPETIREDVRATVDRLREEGLLEGGA
jgi:hypothetical protein